MESNGSLVEFFYNIIPGAIFISLLQYFRPFGIDILNIHSQSAIVISLLLIFSLFLGFFFQAVTIIFRHLGWNEKCFKEVKIDNPVFENVKRTFSKTELGADNKNLFYLMDNKLRGDNRAFLPTYFSSHFAFWSNIFFACILLLLVIFVDQLCMHSFDSGKVPILMLIFFLTCMSGYLSNKFLRSFYDTILNSYYMKFVKNLNK